MRIIYLILLLISTVSYESCSTTKNNAEKNYSIHNYLVEYIDSFPRVENPWNAPLLYIVMIDTIGQDTTVEITSSLSPYEIIDSTGKIVDSYYKGSCLINSAPVLVYDFIDLNNINKVLEPLKLGHQNKSRFQCDTIDFTTWYWTYEFPKWNFILSDDQLIKE